MTALAASAASVSTPSTRSPRRAVIRAMARSGVVISDSILQQVAEHEGTGRQEQQVERHEQAQPRGGLPSRPSGGQLGRLHSRHQDGRGQRQDQEGEHGLPGPGRFGQHPEQAPHRGQPDGAQDQRAGQLDRPFGQREPEQAGHQEHHQDLEDHELHGDRGRLPQEDRRLIHRGEQESLQGPVLSFGLVAATKRQHRGEQHRQPQEPRGGVAQQRPPRPQREAEGDQECGRERKDHPDPVPAAHLDPEVLRRHRSGLPDERHGEPTAPVAGSSRPSSMNRAREAPAPRAGSWVARTTVRPSAEASRISPSTSSFARPSSPAYGSSNSWSSACLTISRASATRWRMPWEKDPTRSPATSPRPTRSSAPGAVTASSPYSEQVKRRFSRAVRSSYRRVRWPRSSVRRRISSRSRTRSKPSTDPPPYVGEMAVAISRRSVLFPAPLGPRIRSVSPRSIRRSTRTRAGATPNTRVTPDRRTAGSSVRPGSGRRPGSTAPRVLWEATPDKGTAVPGPAPGCSPGSADADAEVEGGVALLPGAVELERVVARRNVERGHPEGELELSNDLQVGLPGPRPKGAQPPAHALDVACHLEHRTPLHHQVLLRNQGVGHHVDAGRRCATVGPAAAPPNAVLGGPAGGERGDGSFHPGGERGHQVGLSRRTRGAGRRSRTASRRQGQGQKEGDRGGSLRHTGCDGAAGRRVPGHGGQCFRKSRTPVPSTSRTGISSRSSRLAPSDARWPVAQMTQVSAPAGRSPTLPGRSPTKTCRLPSMWPASHSVLCRTSSTWGDRPDRYVRHSSSSPATGYDRTGRPAARHASTPPARYPSTRS